MHTYFAYIHAHIHYTHECSAPASYGVSSLQKIASPPMFSNMIQGVPAGTSNTRGDYSTYF